MLRDRLKHDRTKRTLGENDLRYLSFIDELRKNARVDSPTSEIARLYREVADILSEAFDEWEASDLPKYKDRLEYIIEITNDEPALSDPLFKEDLQKAKKLLEVKIDERWGFQQKLRHVASVAARSLGGLTAAGREIIDLADRSREIGAKFSTIGTSVRRKVDDEERHQIYDLIKGNTGQYGNNLPSSTSPSGMPAISNTSIVAVKDDKLIGTNTTQNKVLNSLLVVSKDSNKDIKDIKKFLTKQEQQSDDVADDNTLQQLEALQEGGRDVTVKGTHSLLQGIVGPGTSVKQETPSGIPNQEQSGDGILSTILTTVGEVQGAAWLAKMAKKGWKFLRGGATAAGGGTGTLSALGTTLGEAGVAAAASPAALIAGGAIAGGVGAYALTLPAREGARSLAATIGEKRKGINYYKDIFKYELDDAGRETAEGWALEYLYKDASTKQKLFQQAFQDGSDSGDGSYKINNKPVKMDQAAKDVQGAIDMYNRYNKYLQEKKKKGGLTATAAFQGSDGKVYSNPLFKADELPSVKPQQTEVTPTQSGSDFISSDKSSSPFGDSISVSGKETKESRHTLDPSRKFSRNEDAQIEADVLNGIIGNRTDGKSGTSTSITGTTFEEKAPVVMDRLMKDLNISRDDAAAIVGNLGHESAGLKPDINEGKPVIPGSRGGYGWAQWTGSRRRQFEDFAKENNLDISSDEANYQFLLHELRGSESKSLDALKGASSIEEKTVAFEKAYERAGVKHYDKRQQYAHKANAHYDQAEVMLARNDVEMQPRSQQSLENAVSTLSRNNEVSKSQPIVVAHNTPVKESGGDISSVSMKQVGAPANGATETSFLLAMRQSLSPVV